jgi:hypothetical protein
MHTAQVSHDTDINSFLVLVNGALVAQFDTLELAEAFADGFNLRMILVTASA